MDRTFNNGLGMILVVGKQQVNGVTSMLKKVRGRYSNACERWIRNDSMGGFK